MDIRIIAKTDPVWLSVAAYADTCSWDACRRMASLMREGQFHAWERILVAEDDTDFMGFCALVKPIGFPGPEYNPLIKWLFVREKYRGRRLGQKLLVTAAGYAKELGYSQVFLTTWHTGLYEKYGFAKIADKEVRPGYSESIYARKI